MKKLDNKWQNCHNGFFSCLSCLHLPVCVWGGGGGKSEIDTLFLLKHKFGEYDILEGMCVYIHCVVLTIFEQRNRTFI